MATRVEPARYIRPGFFMAHVVNPIAKVIGAPTLIVRGRRSGVPIETPLNPFDYEGSRHLIGGGGETHWVRNLRAAGGGRIRIRGRESEFRAVEILGADRDRIVAAYRDSMGRRAQVYFASLPNPADHPVFRVEPA